MNREYVEIPYCVKSSSFEPIFYSAYSLISAIVLWRHLICVFLLVETIRDLPHEIMRRILKCSSYWLDNCVIIWMSSAPSYPDFVHLEAEVQCFLCSLKVNPEDATFGLFPNPPSKTSWEQLVVCSQLSQSELPDIVGNTCNTLKQRGAVLHGDTVLYFVGQSCIVWTYLKAVISVYKIVIFE